RSRTLQVLGKRWPLLLAALAGAAIASVMFIVGSTGRSDEPRSAIGNDQPDRAREHNVAALGRVEPGSELINLGAGAVSDRLESLLVGRDDLVKKDQVIGYLGGYAEQVAQRATLVAQLDETKTKQRTELALNKI